MSTITVAIDEALTYAEVPLDLTIDPTDSSALIVSYDGTTLDDQDSMIVDYLNGQTVRILTNDFDSPAGTTWTVSASPLTRDSDRASTWADSGATVYDEDDGASPNGEVFQAVTISATAGTATRTKKIYIKIKTSDPMPGGPLE